MPSVDERLMQQALRLAQHAREAGEVPVGAVVVRDSAVLGEGCNRSIAAHDATAHAEIQALRAAGAALGNYRLTGCTLYVTLEPCLMCAGAIVHARIEEVVFAAHDPRTGAAESVWRAFEAPWLNHRTRWRGGVLADKSADLLHGFFRARREAGVRS